MRIGELLREALASAAAQKVPSVLVAVVVAAMCLTTLLTVGRTASAEHQVQLRMEQAGSRQLQVLDVEEQALLTPTVVDQVVRLSTVERAVGVTDPVDVTNGPLGDGGHPVPAWAVTGDLGDVAELTAGRWPRPGEALVSAAAQQRLGMDVPIGYLDVDGRDVAVVGSFSPRSPFEDFAAGALTVPVEPVPSRTLRVVADTAATARATQRAVLGIVAAPDLDAVTVESPATLAELQADVASDLGIFARALLIGVLAAGALLIAVVVLADVLVRRKDLGRRRALGATRATVLAVVVLRNLAPALAGAVSGTVIGAAATASWGTAPPASFTVGTAVLAVLTAIVFAIPPAAFAAARDPVRVLRTP